MGDDGCFFIAVNYLLGQAGMQLTDKSQSMLVNITKKRIVDMTTLPLSQRKYSLSVCLLPYPYNPCTKHMSKLQVECTTIVSNN
jgi:hypothetical protein